MPKRQKSGLYRSRIKIGVDTNGKDIYKYISGSTKAELAEKRRKAVAYYIDGTGLEQDVLFGVYAQKWFKAKKAPNASASSKESYRTALNKDILPVFEWRNLRSIKPLDIQLFINEYAGMSQTKITVLMAALRGIFNSACADRILSQSPMAFVEKPKASRKKERETLNAAYRPRIENVCRIHPRGAYLGALYYLGCRPGEARGLQWGDFNEDFTQVYIQRDVDYKDKAHAGALKTPTSTRWVPVPEPLKALQRPHRGPDSAFCFHGDRNHDTPMAKASGERLWVEFMLYAGLAERIPPEEAPRYNKNDIRRKWRAKITPYALRHNYITMCWENGFDPYMTMKLAGHTSIKTTMDIYTHLSESQKARAKKQVDDMFGVKNEDKQD